MGVVAAGGVGAVTAGGVGVVTAGVVVASESSAPESSAPESSAPESSAPESSVVVSGTTGFSSPPIIIEATLEDEQHTIIRPTPANMGMAAIVYYNSIFLF